MLKVGPTAAMSDAQHKTRDFGVTCSTAVWHWRGDGDGFVSRPKPVIDVNS